MGRDKFKNSLVGRPGFFRIVINLELLHEFDVVYPHHEEGELIRPPLLGHSDNFVAEVVSSKRSGAYKQRVGSPLPVVWRPALPWGRR